MLIRMLREFLGHNGRPEMAVDAGRTPADDFLAAMRRLRGRIEHRDIASARIACQQLFGHGQTHGRLIAELHHAGWLAELLACYQAVPVSELDSALAAAALNELAFCHSLDGAVELAADCYARAFALFPNMPADDLEFHRTYNLGLAQTRTWESPRRRPRFFNLLALLNQCLLLEGAVAECGCWNGLSSFIMCSRIRSRQPAFTGDTYHVFDSFEGLSAPSREDAVSAAVTGQFAASLPAVRQNLADFPDIQYHPGWIPQSFEKLPELRYRFVHVDLDLYAPTLSALEYFIPRMVARGHIVCDDYNWPGARQAVDEISRRIGIQTLYTDTTQAYFVKA